MLAPFNITNIGLPPKTLCLTYDDGPGPDSAELGEFLAARGVRATFFVVGKFAGARPQVLDALHAQGHIIGNHSFEHPDMPYYVSIDGDVRDQVIRTNTLIQKYNHGKGIYFRATYGKWSPEVAKELNIDSRSSYRHVGPIYWDIDGIDCHYWRLGKSVQEAAQAYLDSIEKKGRGVIVMHDGVADMDTVAARNQTLALTKQLVPKLQAMGYRFVGLDEIDDPQLTQPLADTFALRGPMGKFLRYSDAEDSTLHCSASALKERGTQFIMEHRGEGKIALRTADGRYWQVDPDADPTVRLNRPKGECSAFALFDEIPVSPGRMMLRSHNGNYLAGEAPNGGLLLANAPFMRQAWCFGYVPGNGAYLKPVSLAKKIEHIRKRLLFVKSKLLYS
jgi:peptidoglycan/xylan/chitin deacetylase (PgdA/CDA1 family)